MELAEELIAKRCELKLQWLRRDGNQLADDLMNENFDAFDLNFRIPLKGEDMKWRILEKLIAGADNFHQEPKGREKRGQSPPVSGPLVRLRRGSWLPGSPVGFAREIAIRSG